MPGELDHLTSGSLCRRALSCDCVCMCVWVCVWNAWKLDLLTSGSVQVSPMAHTCVLCVCESEIVCVCESEI